ncbi:phospholipase A and acyltransferase 4-like [Ruditapes philippinarum]|uniref:phospholipase A and acyltransferase 4-like n=1 Tax=Ruditapes philippinarum TaxID=129788 RepID=UPI00295BA787|nr:phospholipase A and acyltransferase 4-like [Ruditapes philippinarum]
MHLTGGGYVIHLSPPPSKSSAYELCSMVAATSGVKTTSGDEINFGLFGSIKVRRDKLKDVAAGSPIIVNNECDDEMKPYPRETIVKRAESKLGSNDYNVLKWNCEHFATWCRYGKAVSKQVPFSKGLSRDAYVVQLHGVEVVPHGTLPDDVITIGHHPHFGIFPVPIFGAILLPFEAALDTLHELFRK